MARAAAVAETAGFLIAVEMPYPSFFEASTRDGSSAASAIVALARGTIQYSPEIHSVRPSRSAAAKSWDLPALSAPDARN